MTTGAKMRVYEIAREVGIPNKELIAKIRALGLEVDNHMSSLDPEDVARVKRSLEKDRIASTETKRLSSTVLRRRSKSGEREDARGEEAARPAAAAPTGNGQSVVRRRAAEAAPPRAEPRVREPERPAAEAPPRRPAVERAPEPEPRAAEPRPVAPQPEPSVAKQAPTPEPERAPAESPARPAAAEPRAAEPAPESRATEPTPPPAVREATPAPEQPAARAAEPEVSTGNGAAAPERPRQRVVVQGPPAVDLPGAVHRKKEEPKPAAAEAEAKAPQQPSRPSAEEPVQPTIPVTVSDVEAKAVDRFQAELERARRRVEEREAKEREERDKQREQQIAERDPARPAVGSVINLPMTRIKITERAPTARQVPGQGQIRGRFAQQTRGGPGGRKGARDFGKKKMVPKGKGKQTQITTPAEHKRVIRMEDAIAIPELAKGMGIKANEVLKKLWGMGMMGININANIDFDTAQIIASEFGYEVQNVAFREEEVFVSREDSEEELELRAPVVTVMGHVDHGKTSLLDAIRESDVTKGEAGGITQHIAAYRVSAGEDYGDIVFLDTPGHAAFTEMRARGAQATDIVVLVVAANDGVMPQTIEALNHAKDAKVPIIVAVNKIDLPDANPERARQQLADHGLIPEEWGGDTQYVEVSALKKLGIQDLLQNIALRSEVLELRANPDKPAAGVVIEAKLDRARGPMATVLVQEGRLRQGDTVVAGQYWGKVRAILDDTGASLKEVGPSTPVELLGLDGVPDAGDTVNVAEDEKKAKQVVEHRRQSRRKKELADTAKISLENIMERIQEGAAKELKIVLKADVQGSAEALRAALTKQTTDKVKVNVIQAAVGGITETDVNLAKAGGAIIVGFHVRPAGKAGKLAEQEGVDIKLYDIIYEAIDDVRLAMAGLLAPIKREMPVGQAEVRDTFAIPRIGTVAGCMVTEGKIVRNSLLRVVRDAVQLYEGKVGSLRRFKEDVREVEKGYECGIMVDGFNDIRVGDVIEAYEIVEEAAQL